MPANNRYTLRAFQPADQAALAACDFTFTTRQVLSLRKTLGSAGSAHAFTVRWELTVRELEGQYMGSYGLSDEDWEVVLQRGQTSPSLLVVAEFEGKPVGLLDVSFEDWNETAKVWNLYVDAAHRGQGLGRQLIQRAAEWARQPDARQPDHRARALVVETQTNNYPACQFYRANGFELSGIDDHFYTNDDINAKMGTGEVALFWYLAIQPANQPPAKAAKDGASSASSTTKAPTA